MNGAIAEPSKNTTRNPKTANTIMMGNNQSFFLIFKK